MCRSASVVVRRFGSLVGPAPSLVASKASVAVWCRLSKMRTRIGTELRVAVVIAAKTIFVS